MSEFLAAVADAVNPLLAVAVLVITGKRWRHSWVSGMAYFVAASVGLAGIYAVAAADTACNLWGRFGGDFSLHSAFAVSAAVSLVAWRRRWFGAMCAVIAAYLVLIVALHYHSIADVLTATVVALIITVFGHFVVRRTAQWATRRHARLTS